jgi:acetyl esterase/lipase
MLVRTIATVVTGLVLTASAPQEMNPADIDKLPRSTPTTVHRYGAEPMQFGELRVPAGKGPFPVAIVIHGGCFLREYEGVDGTAPIATALTAKGVATWNIEYRAIGDAGGGWPGTYDDWAKATDALRGLAKKHRLDLSRVVALGHSAGAPAAIYLAARPRLGDSARGDKPLRIKAAVAIDGPPDLSNLAGRDAAICGRPVIAELMGGTQAEQPARYTTVSPLAHLPLGVPQYLITSSPVLPMEIATSYRDAAAAKGDRVEIVPVKGDHFNIIAPGRPQWTQVQSVIVDRALAR